ncbi:DUF6970 domain-containing protein [Dyella sp.]|uniref:DUF6970 domain-containing protein n=1 Tax=Dyella sp. TaxID=1869338 RepID=UPI002D79A744|nr:hypothetical protein [Dyella sp.]HET7330240.1 hypothetical protein [Dyella sp.]
MTRQLIAILLGVATVSGAYAQTNIPPFVAKLIARYESGPLGSSPGAVWQYRYKGETVYYIPRLACCDIMSQLYDAHGKLICRPDGGVAGGGDGKCPLFFKERKDGRQLWRDPRREEIH